MKINEFAKLCDVNTETIRLYRKKGFLHPVQAENGYYEYTEEDFHRFLFARKLRGANLSLDTITYTYQHTEAEEILADFRSEYESLEAQIEELKRRQAMLRLTMDHIEALAEAGDEVNEIEVQDDRYDLLLKPGQDIPELHRWIANIDRFTQGIFIDQKYLCEDFCDFGSDSGDERMDSSGRGVSYEKVCGQERSERLIPVEFSLGSYQEILEREGFLVPPEAICYPKGKYLSMKLELDTSHKIDCNKLFPILEYARSHGYVIDSPVTAFLFRIDQRAERTAFVYRVRVRVRADE